MKERSNTSRRTLDSGDMMLPLFCNQAPIEERLFMPVSPAETKKTISQAKSENCGNATAITKSSMTSEVDSTSSAKDCTPYWTPSCLEMSAKLLSLTETACVGSDLNSSNTWPTNTTAASWFSTTLRSVLSRTYARFACHPSRFFLPTLRPPTIPSCDQRR